MGKKSYKKQLVHKQDNDEGGKIKVKCPKCGHEHTLSHLGGWFFIILGDILCPKCGYKNHT